MALTPWQQKQEDQQNTNLGFPPGFKVYSPFPFGSLDQQNSRAGMEDKNFYWIENIIKIGDGNLRSVWDVGPAIFTSVLRTIVYHYFYTLGATSYCAIFYSDGTADQLNISTNTVTPISTLTSTFLSSFAFRTGSPITSQLPACVQSGSKYLIIANNHQPNAYWIWDGSLLYSAGTISPNITVTNGGQGYTSPPTVTAFGGEGSGVTVQAAVRNGSVVSLTVTNPGSNYTPDDIVQLAFSGGGGTARSAKLLASMSPSVIRDINVVISGSGYITAPSVTVVPVTSGTGALAHAVLNSSGGIASIVIDNPGTNYTQTPGISIGAPPAGGTQATGVAVLGASSIIGVTVLDGGAGFNGTPTLTFKGGGGSGATATANITSGAITSVTMGNQGSGYTSTPAVIVQSGVNDAAVATVELMPTGISGSAIEVFQSRVWITFPFQQPGVINGGVLQVSAPDSLTDFATSSGGLIFTSTDRFLKSQYTAIRQSNNFLYPIGDSSVSIISNVQTGGNPTTTTFNYQNTDPQIGTSFRDSAQDYSRTMLFANQIGVFGMYGGAVTKVSKQLDVLFANAVFPPTTGAITPSSAVATIFNLKFYLLLFTIKDPFTGNLRNVLAAWNEREWFILSQSPSLTYISTQEVNSTLTAWGTDGVNMFPLFRTPSAAILKRISTKLYGINTMHIQKQSLAAYLQIMDQSTNKSGVSITMSVDCEDGEFLFDDPLIFTNTSPNSMIIGHKAPDIVASTLGLTIVSNSLDFTIWNMILGYKDILGICG